MDKLTLKALSFKGYHGFYEQERRQGNDFEVDLAFEADLRPAGQSDRLEETIDYQKVVAVVQEVMEGPPRKLIETLTKHIGDRLVEAFPKAVRLEVTVRKLHPPLEVEIAYSETRMSWQRSL